MAIDAYTGLPRSGKSYSVTKNVIIPSLKEGRTVRTNIPLVEGMTEHFGGVIVQLAKDWYLDEDLCDSFMPGDVVVLDELWRRWPSGLKANKANIKDKEFLAEHGHKVDDQGRTMRVVLVTQDLSQISAWARDLVDKTYRTSKLDAIGANKRFRVDIYQGAVTGQRPPKSQLLRQLFDQYEPEYYSWYKSATHSKTGEVGDESRADKRATIWRSPALWSLVAIMVLGPVFGFWGLSRYFDQGKRMQEEREQRNPPKVLVNPPPPGMTEFAAAAPAVQAPAPDVAQQSAPAGIAISKLWRVGGFVDRAKSTTGENLRTGVVLVSDGGGVRYLPMTDCHYYPDGLYVFCDVDGERVTPWTGRAAVTTVFSSSAAAPAKPAAERSERSDLRPAAAAAPEPPRPATPVTVVADTSRTPRTLLGDAR